MRPIPLLAACAFALPLYALDLSGNVYDKVGSPISGVQVCIKSDPTSCVTTGFQGQFSLVKAIAIRRPGQALSGYSVAYKGGALIVRSPAAATARLEWLSADGHRVWAASDVKLAAGRNPLSLPAGLPHAGICILRLTAEGRSLAWKAVLVPGASASGDAASPASPRIAALSKAAVAPTIEFSKAGYRTRTYSPFSDQEGGLVIFLSKTGDTGIVFEGSLNMKVISIDRDAKSMITETSDAQCDTVDTGKVVHVPVRDTLRYLIRDGKMWTWYAGDCIGQSFTGSASDPVGSWTLNDAYALLPEDIRAGCKTDSGTGLSNYESFAARYTISETRVIIDITAELCPNDILEDLFVYVLGDDPEVMPTKSSCMQMVLKNGKSENATVDYSKKGDSLHTRFTYKTATCDLDMYFGVTPKDPVCPEGLEVVPFMDCLAGAGFANLPALAKTQASAPPPMSRETAVPAARPVGRLKAWVPALRDAAPGGDYISRGWKAAAVPRK